MNARFTAAAQAVSGHFQSMVAKRGEPFEDTFIDPMNNDAVTPTRAGIPVALLKELVVAEALPASETAGDAERFVVLAEALLNPDSVVRELFEKASNGKEPTSLVELREFMDGVIRLRQGGAA